MDAEKLFCQGKVQQGETRYIEFLHSKGIRVDPALRGYYRFLIYSAFVTADFSESAKARREFFKCSGSVLKSARELLIALGLIKMERTGVFRARLRTMVRPTRLFSDVTGI